MTLTALILAHVAEHPGSGATEIALALDRGRDTVAAILSQQRKKGALEVVCRKTVNGRSWPEVKYQAGKNPPTPKPDTNHGGARNKGVPLARKTERPERRSRSSRSGQFAGEDYDTSISLGREQVGVTFNATARVAPKKADFRPALLSLPFAGSLPERTMTPYREQWKDPRWQKKRLEALEAADWQCQNCSGHEVALNVHHKLYRKGALVWDYDIDDLQVLCEPCHQSHHENERALKEVMARGDFEVIAGVVAGYCSIDDNVDQGFVEMLAQATMPHDFAVGYTAALLSFLPFRDLRKVAEFAVSLTKPGSEVRMRFEHDHGVYLKDRG